MPILMRENAQKIRTTTYVQRENEGYEGEDRSSHFSSYLKKKKKKIMFYSIDNTQKFNFRKYSCFQAQ